jgi:hypothetical protein
MKITDNHNPFQIFEIFKIVLYYIFYHICVFKLFGGGIGLSAARRGLTDAAAPCLPPDRPQEAFLTRPPAGAIFSTATSL